MLEYKTSVLDFTRDNLDRALNDMAQDRWRVRFISEIRDNAVATGWVVLWERITADAPVW